MLHPLKLIRMRKGLRQWDVAKSVGVSEAYLSKLETGRATPSPELAARIAGVLGVATEDIRQAMEEPPRGDRK